MSLKATRSSADKIKLFRKRFFGLHNIYGTYDPDSGQSRQVKAPVTDTVIKAHLMGKQSYGVYLLVRDKTGAVVADFDTLNRMPVFEFVSAAHHYGLKANIERSKAKGYHAWIFFQEEKVLAWKARRVVQHIIDEIEQPLTEVFPKQDRLDFNVCYGNFINAPLFGSLVPRGKTVFVDPATFKPFPDQWDFLESVEECNESILDDIIELNDLLPNRPEGPATSGCKTKTSSGFTLPICAQKMLHNGVTYYQRVSCFRLAVHLKRFGLPYDVAIAALQTWAAKNRPGKGKTIITEHEIVEQAEYAFKKDYRSYGCSSEAVILFCEPKCPVNRLRK